MTQIPIFVLSLRGARLRRLSVKSGFAALGLEFSFFDAINGRDLSHDELAAHYDSSANARHFKRSLSPGEVACAMGHHRIWKLIADGKATVALVCEDDILPSPRLVTFLQNIANSPDTFSDVIVKLDGYAGPGRKLGAIGGVDMILTRFLPPKTVGYLIGRRAAQRLLDSRGPIVQPVDMDIKHYWAHGVPVLVGRPLLAPVRAELESGLEHVRRNTKPRALLRRFWRNFHYQTIVQRGRMKSLYAGDNGDIIARIKAHLAGQA